MGIIRKSFARRFTKEEYKQLRKILAEQTRVFRKRPQYIIGNLLLVGLMFYFFFRGFGGNLLNGSAVGCGVALLFMKAKDCKKTIAFFIMFPVMFFFLRISGRSDTWNWEYLLYAALVLMGFMCSTNSIKEHLCETILNNEKSKQSDNPIDMKQQ